MTEIFHYPDDLERLVAAQWPADLPTDPLAEFRRPVLEVAYHASMMREEGRAIRVRMALVRAEEACAAVQPPPGALVLRLDRSRPLDVEQLRRIAHAAPFESALVAVEPDETGQLRIWGTVATGDHWLAASRGGRAPAPKRMPATNVHVRGPAQLGVYAGGRFVAGLEGGRLVTQRTDVFASRWMRELFAATHEGLDRGPDGGRDAPEIDDDLGFWLPQQVLRRALWLMREAHHGGILLFAEPDDVAVLLDGVLRAKYRLGEGAARSHYATLLRAVGAARAARAPRGGRGPDLLRRATDLADLEASIFDLSRTLASLSAVDGAVLVSKRFELHAYGVEIANAAARDDVRHARIRRALDTEGEELVDDHEENVGTRHRAAYRYVQAHPRGLAIVVSQDGSVRFVRWRDGDVTYHDQHLAG